MSKREEKEKAVKLLKENIFKIGFEVGYYRHSEDYGWVNDIKKKLFAESVENSVDDVFEAIYEEGKKKGRQRRQFDDAKSTKTPQQNESTVKKFGAGNIKINYEGDDPDKVVPISARPDFIEMYPAITLGKRFLIPLFLEN